MYVERKENGLKVQQHPRKKQRHKKEAGTIQTGRKKVIRKHNNRPKHVNGDMIEFKR